MAKFLNTSATNYFLEELIKSAGERLVLISPYLKMNERIKELLTDKSNLKVDIRIIYGKSELPPQDVAWLANLNYVRTSFCKNLHAKCYLNERMCIVTSLNLYEFSQVNNNEMGILINREEDRQLFEDAREEAQRILRISEEIEATVKPAKRPARRVEETKAPRVAAQPVTRKAAPAQREAATPEPPPVASPAEQSEKLTTSKLAKQLTKKTAETLEQLRSIGYLEQKNNRDQLSSAGKKAGGERHRGRFGSYFLWPASLDPFAISPSAQIKH